MASLLEILKHLMALVFGIGKQLFFEVGITPFSFIGKRLAPFFSLTGIGIIDSIAWGVLISLVFVSIVGLKKFGIQATILSTLVLYLVFCLLLSQWWFWLLLGLFLAGGLYWVFARRMV